MPNLNNKLMLLPTNPGCYLMKNKDNNIIYVGKAKNLKNRVNSYFKNKHTGKTAKLVSEIYDFEYIVVNSETESLILELNLIKKYDPKYNILLRDDKTYPYIELTDEESPRLLVVRNINKKKSHNRMYGPYPNSKAARTVVNLLNRIYPLRKCAKYPKKPCLYYHIGQCLGYCINKQDNRVIKEMEAEIIRFLKGDAKFIADKITLEMQKESEKLNFEKALELKIMLDEINIILEKQKVEIKDNHNIDVFGYCEKKGYLGIQVLFIRNGKILERHSNIFSYVDDIEEEVLRYIANFYQKDIILPKEILVPQIVDNNLLEDFLKIKVRKPQIGEKKKIVEMANMNAKINLEEKFELILKDEEKTTEANEQLKQLLKLKKLDRIEIFDNSNLFGSFNVSGMVVFKNGKPSKNDYRKFKISIDKNDDYNTMREVIYRRYFKILKNDLERPDLIIVDGGIGQINVAREIINSLNLDIPVVGLKKDKKHTTESLLANDPIEQIMIDKKTNVFYLLERMQDEVHNFTINYHKQLRSKGSLESILESIDGIGTKRKEELLKKYKTINKLKELTLLDLEEILPTKVASNLYQFLKQY